jgi:hypothetical protein
MVESYAINADRGEVGITLDGAVFPLRPSYDAQAAIESQTGCTIEEMWARMRRLATALDGLESPVGAGLTLSIMSVIVRECIRAAGKQRNDAVLKSFQLDRIMELIARDRFAMTEPITKILTNMLFGGDSEKKADAAPVQVSPSPAAN